MGANLVTLDGELSPSAKEKTTSEGGAVVSNNSAQTLNSDVETSNTSALKTHLVQAPFAKNGVAKTKKAGALVGVNGPHKSFFARGKKNAGFESGTASAIPTQIVIPKGGLAISDGSERISLEEIIATYPKGSIERDFAFETTTVGARKSAILAAFADEYPQYATVPIVEVERAAHGIIAQFARLLRVHFQQTVEKHQGTVREVIDGVDMYDIPNGIAFWTDFLAAPTPDLRIVARAFVDGNVYRQERGGYALKLIKTLTSGVLKKRTLLLDVNRFGAKEKAAIAKLAQSGGYHTIRFGRMLIVGKGPSFHLTRDIFLQAEKLKDPVLSRKFERVVRFMAHQGIDIELDYHQGAAAYFVPSDNKIGYVMPSRADLNSFTHEGTHARFQRFDSQVRAWAEKRQYAIPYEVDGPPLGFLPDGAFTNLLNELNSWRIGESFTDGGADDTRILATLTNAYGKQAGEEAARSFASIWSAEKIFEKSVPALMRTAIRATSNMSNADVLELGRISFESSDAAGQHNFIRLVRQQHLSGGADPKCVKLLETCCRHSKHDNVRYWGSVIQKLVNETKDDSGWKILKEKQAAWEMFKKEAHDWLHGFESDEIPVIPSSVSWDLYTVLFLVQREGLTDLDATLERLSEEFGHRLDLREQDRSLFAKIMESSGSTLAEKLVGYLRDWNGRHLDVLWTEFRNAPSYELGELLLARHKDELDESKVCELLNWALMADADEQLHKCAQVLYPQILGAHGIERLPADLSGHVQTTAGVRSPRPDHWLFASRIDKLLAKGLLDGTPSLHRMKVIDTLVERTYPSEFPQLFDRVVESITCANPDRFDRRLALFFLIPESSHQETPLNWGDAIVEGIMNAPNPSDVGREFVAEHYRLVLSKALSESPDAPILELDPSIRQQTLSTIQSWSPEATSRYQKALNHLATLLACGEPRVMCATRYAIASHPAFLIGLEDKIVELMQQEPSPTRLEAVSLVAMVQTGGLPKVDALINGKWSPTEEEVHLLETRHPIVDQQLWQRTAT